MKKALIAAAFALCTLSANAHAAPLWDTAKGDDVAARIEKAMPLPINGIWRWSDDDYEYYAVEMNAKSLGVQPPAITVRFRVPILRGKDTMDEAIAGVKSYANYMIAKIKR